MVNEEQNQDEKGISTNQVTAFKMAGFINEFQKQIDEYSYYALYPDEEQHLWALMMRILTRGGKAEIAQWLKQAEGMVSIPSRARELKQQLETADIIWPEGLPLLVRIKTSADDTLNVGDILPLHKADTFFAKLNREQSQAKQKEETTKYNKITFTIDYQLAGLHGIYEGRQDFGAGGGGLLAHMEQYHGYYRSRKGEQELALCIESERAEILQLTDFVLDELIPSFKYFCNLSGIEQRIKENQVMSEQIPILHDAETARREYLADMQKFVTASRIALTSGGELPNMPDIKDYQQSKETESHREQIMTAIEGEAKANGMTVEDYAENGFESRKDNKRIAINNR